MSSLSLINLTHNDQFEGTKDEINDTAIGEKVDGKKTNGSSKPKSPVEYLSTKNAVDPDDDRNLLGLIGKNQRRQ